MGEGDSKESIRAELQGSVEFVVGVLVFGASVFAFLMNLCFLAVGNDIELKKAYLVISQADSQSKQEVESAIAVIDKLLFEDVRTGGRPVLCEEDLELIELYPKLEGPSKQKLREVLARKTGLELGWKDCYLQNLPGARSPFRMPFLELSLMYYGWVIEIGTIIFLSQSLRKPHVQLSLYNTIRKPGYFIPGVTLLLFVPVWHWLTLLYAKEVGMGVAAVAALLCLVCAWLLFQVAKTTLTPNKMNEMGFHLLISSLFIQLLTVMGDPDVVYTVFSAPRMAPLRYLSWFIILCYPGLLMEKWLKARKEKAQSGSQPLG